MQVMNMMTNAKKGYISEDHLDITEYHVSFASLLNTQTPTAECSICVLCFSYIFHSLFQEFVLFPTIN